MLVSEAMTHGVKTIRPDATLQEAAKEMNKYHISCLIAISGSGSIEGIITERDAMKAVEKNLLPSKTKVEDFMTKKDDLILIEQNATLEEAADAMEKYKVKRLPVVNEEENLVGIITATDLISKKELMSEKIENLIGMKKKQFAGIAG